MAVCITMFTASLAVCTHTKIYFKILFCCLLFVYMCCSLPALAFTLIARVHYTFVNTEYEVNPRLLRALSAILTVIVIVNFVNFSVLLYSEFIETLAIENHSQFRKFSVGFSMLLYIVLLITLSSILVQKLNDIMLSQANIKNTHRNVELSNHQTLLISQIARYLVISVFGYSTTILVVLCVVVVIAIDNAFIDHIRNFLVLCDIVCSALCVYLQFAHASNEYYRMCGICDRKCKKILQRRAELKMELFTVEVQV